MEGTERVKNEGSIGKTAEGGVEGTIIHVRRHHQGTSILLGNRRRSGHKNGGGKGRRTTKHERGCLGNWVHKTQM